MSILWIAWAILAVAIVGVSAWGLWVAFTQGDDVIARFGRKAIKTVAKKLGLS